MIDLNRFVKIFPNCNTPSVWVDLLNENLTKDISGPLILPAFLSQIGHESQEFNVLVENLNYSAVGLIKTFGKYFNENSAKLYARQPEKIASLVYANRLGNGDEKSKDGWTYRGRGLIQITGKSNYIGCSIGLYGNQDVLLNFPELLEDPKLALKSAIWFWKKNNCSDVAGNVKLLTKRINGGQNGLEEREELFIRAQKYLS
jgi:putative chitinase